MVAPALLVAPGCFERHVAEGPPEIVRFSATPNAIVAGEPVEISWETMRAESVSIRIIDASPVFVSDVGDPAERRTGLVVVRPRTSTTYVIEATSGIGTVTERLSVAVASGTTTPIIQRFVANVYRLERGEVATLSWQVTGADRVVVVADGPGASGAVVETQAAAAQNGSVDVRPYASTAYTLTAYGEGGGSSAQVYLELPESLAIESFRVSRAAINPGREVAVSWKVTAAMTVHLGDAEGNTLYHAEANAADPQSLEAGVIYVAPTADTEYWLVATNSAQNAQSVVAVSVVAPPQIAAFTADADVVPAGSAVTLRWDTNGATTVSLLSGAKLLYSQIDEAVGIGVYEGIIEEDSLFTLIATNAGESSDSRQVTVSVRRPMLEIEMWPNVGARDTIVDVTWNSDSNEPVNLSATGAIFSDEHIVEVLAKTPFTSVASGTNALADFADGDNCQRVDLGFTVESDRGSYSELYVSKHGYVTFGGTVDLSSAGLHSSDILPPGVTVVAAGWPADPFNYDNANFHAERRGAAPNRELVIEWRGLVTLASPFNVHLQLAISEDGRILRKVDRQIPNAPRLYLTVLHPFSGSAVAGSAVRIDAWDIFADVDLRYDFVARTARRVPPSGSRKFVIPGVSRFTDSRGFMLDSGGEHAFEFMHGPSRATLIINEVMANPLVPDADGEWLEVYNYGSKDMRLADMYLQTTPAGSNTMPQNRTVFPGHTVLPAGDYLVLGANADPLRNGGFEVDLEYTVTNDLTFPDDIGTISVGISNFPSPLRQGLAYVQGDSRFPVVEGAAMMVAAGVPPESLNSGAQQRDPDNWCPAHLATPSGSKGTAGAANGACAVGDTCAEAIVLDVSAGSAVVSGTTTRAVDDWSDVACGENLSAADVVYTFVLNEDRFFTASVDTSRAAAPRVAYLHLYETSCPNTGGAPVLCATPGGGGSSLQGNLAAGTYSLVVDAIVSPGPSPAGVFDLEVQTSAPLLLRATRSQAAFTTLDGTATSHVVPGDDGTINNVDLGFSIQLYDRNVTQVHIATNGYLSSTGGVLARYINAMLPSRDPPGGTIAPLWDDLIPGPNATIRTQSFAAPTRHFVIEWRDFDFLSSSDESPEGASLEFQVALFESGVVEFRYGQLLPGLDSERSKGGGATIGVESADGTMGATWSFNVPSVQAGDVIRWQP